MTTRTEEFERSRYVEITFPPHVTTVIELKPVAKGVPYWSRPDLGIGAGDVKVEGRRVKVTVHQPGIGGCACFEGSDSRHGGEGVGYGSAACDQGSGRSCAEDCRGVGDCCRRERSGRAAA